MTYACRMIRSMALLSSLLCGVALAQPPADPASLYELVAEPAAESARSGEPVKLRIAIRSKQGAYVSNEAPLRIDLSAQNATPAKERLTRADAIAAGAPTGQKPADPSWEAAYTAGDPGTATLEAKIAFFICTENLCARQQRTVSVPVQVTASKKAL